MWWQGSIHVCRRHAAQSAMIVLFSRVVTGLMVTPHSLQHTPFLGVTPLPCIQCPYGIPNTTVRFPTFLSRTVLHKQPYGFLSYKLLLVAIPYGLSLSPVRCFSSPSQTTVQFSFLYTVGSIPYGLFLSTIRSFFPPLFVL